VIDEEVGPGSVYPSVLCYPSTSLFVAPSSVDPFIHLYLVCLAYASYCSRSCHVPSSLRPLTFLSLPQSILAVFCATIRPPASPLSMICRSVVHDKPQTLFICLDESFEGISPRSRQPSACILRRSPTTRSSDTPYGDGALA
jgi:hypothetical protein